MEKLKVYYGFTKLTKKAIRKPELSVFFENGNNNTDKNRKFIERRIVIVHERFQSKEELTDSKGQNRMFTKYSYFIDEKPFKGNIDLAIDQNLKADRNHVSTQERVEIWDKLRKAYFEVYNRKEDARFS